MWTVKREWSCVEHRGETTIAVVAYDSQPLLLRELPPHSLSA